ILQTLVTLPLLRPEYFSKGILSRHFINGVLLFGPPGTGKTMLAKAVAKSSGARFMNIALSNIFDKYVGEGEKNVKAIFTLARKISPCVIFLDEVDAIFGSRRNDTHGARREIINEFMSEWDGLTSNNHGIIVVGATNRPFDLDDAILRRMPRRVLIDLPSEEQRMKILEIHLRDEQLDETVDVKNLARKTASYSGSDLKSLCVAAALARVRETLTQDHSTKNGRRSKRPDSSVASLGPFRAEHFNAAMRDVPPSLTDETQTLVELRKWDETYGDAAGRRKGAAKKGWGF
ncbi:P-loop containing nucleoside triphosphate hydrolase protein, partial [Gaertneriomyces semiglobifer]